MATKSLYISLKENGLIKEERYISEPSRRRAKTMGYMWAGELEVILSDGLRMIFFFCHHCHDDDGETWYPSQKELDSFWTPKFVPQEKSPEAILIDANWHLIYTGGKIYVSKIGFFSNKRNMEEVTKSIQDGTWIDDSDLWCLI